MLLVDALVRHYPTRAERPLVYAHRGASAEAPENTLEAFELARAQGADGFELDVMVCGSGEVVVCHDPWLTRLAQEQVLVHEASLAQLQHLDVSAHFPAWRGPARIPTLEAVLGAFPGALLNIELKEERSRDAGLAAQVAGLVAEHHAQDRVCVSSFNPLELARMRAYAPRLPLALLLEQQVPSWAPGAALALGVQAIHAEHLLLDRPRVARWNALGLRVGAWTIDDPVRAEQVADLGVDAVITNRPAWVRARLERTRRL
jgi:glycerophosphoryl diester phosphodiesterase